MTRYSDVFVFSLADTIDDEENDDMTIDDDENDNGNGDDSLLFSRDGSQCLSCIAGHLKGLPILWVKNFVIGSEEHIGLARLA